MADKTQLFKTQLLKDLGLIEIIEIIICVTI